MPTKKGKLVKSVTEQTKVLTRAPKLFIQKYVVFFKYISLFAFCGLQCVSVLFSKLSERNGVRETRSFFYTTTKLLYGKFDEPRILLSVKDNNRWVESRNGKRRASTELSQVQRTRWFVVVFVNGEEEEEEEEAKTTPLQGLWLSSNKISLFVLHTLCKGKLSKRTMNLKID